MPLKLVPPSKARHTPYYRVRGSHLGVGVDRSTKTDREELARRILKRWQREIERGEYAAPQRGEVADEASEKTPRTFAEAVVAYIQAGGDGRFLGPALEQLGTTEIDAIDQAAIDAAAEQAFPGKGAPYKNRNFYTPVSAVLKRAGRGFEIARPIGWRGSRATSWLEPAEAFRLFRAADKLDREFGLFLRFLCYTGMRLSEALRVKIAEVNLPRRTVYLPQTKNDEPRAVYLPGALLAALRRHPRGIRREANERLFRFHASGRLRERLSQAKAAAKVVKPRRQGGFHLFCHTYGTWMTRYGGLDTFGLVRTARWKDPKSADRYRHTEPSSEAKRAERFPSERRA